jgi:hypothetical protein
LLDINPTYLLSGYPNAIVVTLGSELHIDTCRIGHSAFIRINGKTAAFRQSWQRIRGSTPLLALREFAQILPKAAR